jgi:GH25 family lysozyme M1 (1,4-beta-N-acetylmuramidase)
MRQALIPLESLRAELRRRLEMIRRQRPFPGRSIGTFGGPARAPAIHIEENTMNTEAHDTQAEKEISAIDIECAKIDLDNNCRALSAIANAIEVLASLDTVPEDLFSHTIPRLAKHAVYLADSMQNDVGCFIENVEAAQ